MIARLLVSAALTAMPMPQAATATATADRCAAHAAAIADAVKAMSWASVVADNETSAPRASVIAGEQTVQAVSVQTRVALMAADGCSAYQGPIGPDAYRDAVMQCRAANRERTGTETPPACERSTWQPTPGAL